MSDFLTIDTSYDSEHGVMLMTAPSRRALGRMVRNANPGEIDTGCGHDCSGRICGRYAQLLRAYRVGREWVGVVHVQVSRDV